MITIEPIGVLRTPHVERARTPRQPAASDAPGVIELHDGRGLEDALADLDSFTHVWVLFWFDRAGGWRPKVQPPRDTRKRGVFATRAPRRPNPIGLSAFAIDRIERLRVHVRGVDALDGTPVLDLKPYVPYTDAIAMAGHGWLAADPRPDWEVAIDSPAREQLDWLAAEHGIDLRGPLLDALALGPQPHAYRRIRREPGGYRIALKDWRVSFRVEGRAIRVQRVTTGYRARQLAADPALAPHRELVARFG
jgi:tRNA-Thr(GGU) m(6)t(6)A37 methyltransferase TsaA